MALRTPFLRAAFALAFASVGGAETAVAQCPACVNPSFGPASRAYATRVEEAGVGFGQNAKFVAVGDFNNDGVPDLAADGGVLLIFLGTGTGSYSPPNWLPSYVDPRAIAVEDFNGDGNQDLAIAASGALYVLPGDGTGGFASVQTWIALGVERIAVGDFDGDAIPDMATAKGFGDSGAIQVFHGVGDGTFSPPQTIPIGSGAYGEIIPRAGDFNGDATDDLAVASTGDGKIGIVLGHPGGLSVSYAPSPGPAGGDLRVGDFDGNGVLDILAQSQSGFNGPWSLTVLHGLGNGTFVTGTSFVVGYSFIFDAGDVDGDGKLDVALIRTYGPDGLYNHGVFVFPGTGSGTFGAPVRTLIPVTGSSVLVLADLNRDGHLDVARPDPGSAESVAILLGKGDGHFEETPRFSVGVETLQSIVSADFNNDQIPDIAATGFSRSQIGIVLGTGAGGFQAPQVTEAHHDGDIVAADFNHDGKMDVAVADGFEDLSVLLGLGNGALGAPIRTAKEHELTRLAAADVDKDGNPDVLLSFVTVGKVVFYRGKGDGTFFPPTTVSTQFASSFAVGDVNGDGKVDLLLAEAVFAPETLLDVYLGAGNGSFSAPISSVLQTYAGALALGDMNNDAKIDVVALHPYQNSVGVLLGNGTGSFAALLPAPTNRNGRTLALADLTGDGLLDAVVTSQDNVAVIPGKGAGELGRPRLFTMPGEPRAAAVGNFGGDGKPDIAVGVLGSVYEPPDFVALLLNTSCQPRRIDVSTDVNVCAPPGPLPSQPVVQTLDDGDNLACAAGSVTAAIVPGTGTPGAALGGTPSAPVVNGTAAFTNLSIATPGTGYVLQFTHAAAGVTRSRPFTVGSAPPVSIDGPSSFCASGSYTASSGFDTYVWTVDGTFVGTRATIALDGHMLGRGAHTLHVTATRDGCEVSSSLPIQVTLPNVTVTSPTSVCPYAVGVSASVPDAGPGASYAWAVTNGVITAGAGTRAIQFHPGPAGNAVLSVVVTNAPGCSDTGSRTVAVDPAGCPPPIGFYTVTPCRVLDTREPAGPYGGPQLATGTSRNFVFVGQCGVPADAIAVSLNLTVTQPTAAGFLTASPGGTPGAVVSTINYRPGQTRSNNALIALGSAGDLSIFCYQISGTTHAIVDVTGYFR